MSGFAAQRSRPPWMVDPGAASSSEASPAGDVREYDSAAAADSKELGSPTNASAISFGFAATAILICMFLVMAIFEHLIKPGWASSRRSQDNHGEPPLPSHSGRHDGSPDKLPPPPKTEDAVVAVDLTVVMPGQRYPTFLAQPAPLLREGMRWPLHLHDHRRSVQPPPWLMTTINSV